ncbi:site-specific integrase [Candidatus Enterococcus ferrettii]|uniref:Site-specific integrase n=1 Tax=Candidatus Enterococcus ferrettii TaxID=2815324 RepID=A0ABV0EPC0_9ENTE|nr:site-specific integrase [Enterococcus sp. 665A]MBO1340912.1 site-specific integrase [Enterococcus sp. 665A]
MSRRGENIYKRKDGRWEGRYEKGRKETGRIKYGYVYSQSYQDVRQKLYALKVKYQTISEMNGRSAIPVIDWSRSWLSLIQETIRPSTHASYTHKLAKYVYPIIGFHPLNGLETSNIQQLITQWRKQNLAPSTIQVLFRMVSQCLKEAVKQGLLKNNPCDTIQLPRVKRTRVKALTLSEQRQLERTSKTLDSKSELPVLLALYAGLRIGEIAALRWENIDFEQGIVRVDHTYQRISVSLKEQKTQLCYSDTKTEASVRVVPLTKLLLSKLRTQRKRAKGPFVMHTQGKPCEPRLLTYHFHQVRTMAGLEGIHFHQLRHTFATRCIEANGDIASVSALLGHASTKMTLDVYIDAMLEQRFIIIERLEHSIA